MASTVTFYTTAMHRRAKIINANETASGTDKVNVMDNNLNTIWASATYGGSRYLDIDTYPGSHAVNGAAPTSGSIDAYGCWIHNYNEDFSTTPTTCSIYSSDDNSSWGARGTFSLAAGPLNFGAVSTRSERYYRIRFDNIHTNIEISHLFLLRTRTIQTRPQYDIRANPTYYNDYIKLRGGREHVYAQALNCTYEFTQKYAFVSTANKTAFDNIFHDSNGRLRPFIYQEGTSVADAYLCRLMQDKWNVSMRRYHYYEATLKMKTLPYIEDGENF